METRKVTEDHETNCATIESKWGNSKNTMDLGVRSGDRHIMQKCWGCHEVRPVLPKVCLVAPRSWKMMGYSHQAVGVLVVGNYRSRATFRGTHHKEGAVVADNTEDRSLVNEGREPVAEGRQVVDYYSPDSRMIGVGEDLGACAAWWETHCKHVSRDARMELKLRTQVDRNSLIVLGKECTGCGEGCSIQAIGRGNRVREGEGQPGQMWEKREREAHFPGDRWER